MNTSASPPTHVHVQGSGIVAHVAALALARQGLQVALSPQRVSPGHGDVRAYAINSASRALLQSLKVWDALPEHAACPVSAMQVHADAQTTLHFHNPANCEALAWIVDVPALEATLRSAVKFASGVRSLREGETCEADLLLVCEGRASLTRAQLGVEFDITPYGQSAIAARLHCDSPHEGVARQWFGSGERGDILALLPLDSPNEQGQCGHTVALVWSVSPERVQQLQALDKAGFEQALGSACGHTLGNMQLVSERLSWPLQRALASRCTGAGWALVGDAAHNVHPLAGQGLNLGLADVQTLASVLAKRESHRSVGDAKLLRRYERARSLDTAAMSQATDGIFRLFAHTDTRVQALGRWGVKLFDGSTGLKSWTIRQAMGV